MTSATVVCLPGVVHMVAHCLRMAVTLVHRSLVTAHSNQCANASHVCVSLEKAQFPSVYVALGSCESVVFTITNIKLHGMLLRSNI